LSIQKPSHTFTKIHLKALRTPNLNILFFLSFTVFINTFGFAQGDFPKPAKQIPPVETIEAPEELMILQKLK